MSEQAGSSDRNERVILIPIDGSPHCDRAFVWYLEHMKRANDCVRFVNVIEPVYASPAFGVAVDSPPLPDFSRLMMDSIDSGKNLCRQYVQRAKDSGLTAQAFIHVDSRPGSAIVKAIKSHAPDIVVMGNRGLGAIRRTFLGSVSDYVLHHAAAPVVIVPPGRSDSK
ncbi:unnamed protein product [Dicrocoelium dendriticum]|nr:unnamed protein product [Dicrocoelium dendriticum]